MREYIIEWFGIGTRIVELMNSETSCLAVKHLREERLREKIVRCRDCKHYEPNMYSHFTCELLQFHVEPNGFCAWGERKNNGFCAWGERKNNGNS